VLERVAGRLAQGDHALLAALAPDDQHARVPGGRRGRQPNQLGNSQTSRIEQLEHGRKARALRPWAGAGRAQQAFDLRLAQNLGQAAALTRAVDRGRRVIGAQPFGKEKSMELAQRGKTARGGARGKAGLVQATEVGADILGAGAVNVTPSSGQESREVLQIAGIGLPGIRRRAAFGGEHFDKALDMPGAGHLDPGQMPLASAASMASARASFSKPMRLSAVSTVLSA
jgi:hypothetical protein